MLRDSILGRTLIPGQRLDIETISLQMGISRMPVKQALDRLAGEGLVNVVPQRGTFVAEPSLRRVTEVFEVRTALELLAAERIIAGMTSQRLLALRGAVKAMEAVSDHDDVASHMEKNRHFHTLLIESAGNETLAQMYSQLDAHIQIARVHYRSDEWHQRTEQERHEHWAIVDAIEQGNLGDLKGVLKTHIERAKESLLADIEDADRDTTPLQHAGL
jgi:DNA-binding GntR family transcriptional regulator